MLAAARKATTEAARRSEHVLSQMLQAQTAEYCRALARQSSLPSDGLVTLWSFDLKAVKPRSQAQSAGPRIAQVVDRILMDPRASTLLTGHFDGHLAVATSIWRSAEEFTKTLTLMLQRAASSQGMTVVGSGWDQLTDEQSPSATWEQACFAARISKLSHDGTPLGWSQLGAWHLLYRQEWSPRAVQRLSPGCDHLIRHENPRLWRTLLVYLDAACDVTTTCTTLHIQRATLYYRLGRIREIAGGSLLNDGWERTSGHLALKLHAALVDDTDIA